MLCLQCTMVSVMPWGARPPTEIQQGFFSGFPRMQSGMFVILCNTVFNCCNFNRYIYIFTCGPYIQTFLVWPFMPENRNFNHSVWLILYSKPLDLKCMKWINPLNAELNPICHLLALLRAHHILHISRIRVKSTLCCDCYTKIKLFFYSGNTFQMCTNGTNRILPALATSSQVPI